MDISKSTIHEQFQHVLSLGGLFRIIKVCIDCARIITVRGDELSITPAALWEVMNHEETRNSVGWQSNHQLSICASAWILG